jgi:hypothetical protein
MSATEPLVRGEVPAANLEKVGKELKEIGLRRIGIPPQHPSPPSILAFLGITLVMVAIIWICVEIADYQEITSHWETYRCMPSVTPFAKFYGHDLDETVNFCIGEAVKQHSAGVMVPIYEGVAKVAGVVDGVYTKAEAVEGGVTHLLSGFTNFVVNFANSFNLIQTRIRVGVVKIKEIFGRVHGLFMSFVFAGISAMSFGQNLACNPLVTFVADIAGADICCFAPDTLIPLRGGSLAEIANIRIGDILASGGRVTSLYRFDGRGTPMVRIHGVHVSGNHAVHHEGRWIRADAHPAAVAAEELPRILCLGTSDNRIPVVAEGLAHPLIFTDFEETEDPDVVAEVQAAAEVALGMPAGQPTVEDYSLGLDPQFQVTLVDGRQKRLEEVVVGDVLVGGGRVRGVIREECEECVVAPGGRLMSVAQLVGLSRGWQRAGRLWPDRRVAGRRILWQLMLGEEGPAAYQVRDIDGLTYFVRDYTEVSGSVTQAPYDRFLGLKK